ncbi:hypothetical protein QQX98_007743 [Neonectria punicea]|uniref:Uncharacterized protein n=1 Tax=Neonectria punicea TaxID=979145 RepID=A0ABR1GX09_9HYPO
MHDIGYARGTWGYTVFRTVYTEESDRLFPIAVEKLQKWLTQYHFHSRRFPLWGERGEARQKTNGSVNVEVARRFRMEIIEDKTLDMTNLRNATTEDIKLLCSQFCSWVTSVGGDPECDDCSTNPLSETSLHPSAHQRISKSGNVGETKKWVVGYGYLIIKPYGITTQFSSPSALEDG